LQNTFCCFKNCLFTVYYQALAGEGFVAGIVVAVQTFCVRINFHPHLHLLVTDPAIDISRAGTRKEELLIEEQELNRIWILRKVLSQMNEVEAVELLIDKLSKTKTNQDFISAMSKGL